MGGYNIKRGRKLVRESTWKRVSVVEVCEAAAGVEAMAREGVEYSGDAAGLPLEIRVFVGVEKL